MLGGGPLQRTLTDENTPRAAPGESEALMQKIYGGDEKYFMDVSPYEMAESNKDEIRDKTTVRQIVGANDEVLEANLDFHAHLTRSNITHEFRILPGASHALPEYLKALGDDNFEFYNLVFGE